MPQFDSVIVLPELFWLFLSFIFLYLNLAIFNKMYLLRSNFFRKTWLFSFLKFSKDLHNNIKISSQCYLQNLYYNYLQERGIFLTYKILSFDFLKISQNNLINFINLRKDFHTLIKNKLN
jgi:hypothetical protein